MSQKTERILFVAVALLLVFAGQWNKGCKATREPLSLVHPSFPDTVYVQTRQKEYIQVPVQKQSLPEKITVYLPDTSKRRDLEQDTLITGVKLEGQKISIHQITPVGISLVSEYALPERSLTAVEIDAEGKVAIKIDQKAERKEKRKKRWRKIGNGAMVAGAFLVGVLIAK
jgi:hypothetical protein